MMESPDPPFLETYKTLLNNITGDNLMNNTDNALVAIEELPVIDLSRLKLGEVEREECKREIAEASRQWGFFQVVKHGIPREVLEKMRFEQVELFKRPFQEKANDVDGLGFSAGSYRWGTPSANCIRQLSWSEAFHVPVADVSAGRLGGLTGLSSAMEQFARTASELAQTLAEILAEKIMGSNPTIFKQHCSPNTCYLRMNRYPPCPISSQVYGLIPHTDTDFLTIVHQDQIGGLQIVKDGEWVDVRPNQEALLVNIGDLFQAWSNGAYKSVYHRVVASKLVERFSTAYFLCPTHNTVIRSCIMPQLYRSFSYGEYREQTQDDVKKLGQKIGLQRFLI